MMRSAHTAQRSKRRLMPAWIAATAEQHLVDAAKMGMPYSCACGEAWTDGEDPKTGETLSGLSNAIQCGFCKNQLSPEVYKHRAVTFTDADTGMAYIVWQRGWKAVQCVRPDVDEWKKANQEK